VTAKEGTPNPDPLGERLKCFRNLREIFAMVERKVPFFWKKKFQVPGETPALAAGLIIYAAPTGLVLIFP